MTGENASKKVKRHARGEQREPVGCHYDRRKAVPHEGIPKRQFSAVFQRGQRVGKNGVVIETIVVGERELGF